MRGSTPGAMSEFWIAGTENDLRLDVNVEFFFECLANINLGENTEALFLEGILDSWDGILVSGIEFDTAE